jgi:RNA polymerase sigma-70 factor, ECF subfamily
MQVDRAQPRAAVEKFMAAISTGDVQGLVEVLASDVVLIADGGGRVAAARRPITGVEKVVAFLARVATVPDFVATSAWLNGMPGARVDIGGAATAVSLVVEDGRITRIYAIANPHKLRWLERWRNCRGDRPRLVAIGARDTLRHSRAWGFPKLATCAERP